MRDKDIYRWRYNDKTLKEMDYKINAGTLYWCNSQIGIWDAKLQRLIDTYWCSDNKYFNREEIKDKLILKYVGNLNNLRPCGKHEFNNYADKDCVNISHSNMSSSGFYIKINAKPNLAKKKKVIKAHIEHYEHELQYNKRQIEYYKKQLEEVTVDTIAPCDREVCIY